MKRILQTVKSEILMIKVIIKGTSFMKFQFLFRASLHFPRSIEALKNLSTTLQHYRDDHLAYLLLLYCSAYLYKQSFSLPGSAILVGLLYLFFVFGNYNLYLYTIEFTWWCFIWYMDRFSTFLSIDSHRCQFLLFNCF